MPYHPVHSVTKGRLIVRNRTLGIGALLATALVSAVSVSTVAVAEVEADQPLAQAIESGHEHQHDDVVPISQQEALLRDASDVAAVNGWKLAETEQLLLRASAFDEITERSGQTTETSS